MKAHVVFGLLYGDEGKGTTVDAYVRKFKSDLVVRFNGGPQAAHNVIDDQRHHTFSSWGSGTLAGAKTLISKYCLVDPLALIKEARILDLDPLEYVYVDSKCPVITEFHKRVNRINAQKSGVSTCGKGIGTTVEHSLLYPEGVLFYGDLSNKDTVISKLEMMKGDLNDISNYYLYYDFDEINIERLADYYIKCYKEINCINETRSLEMVHSSNNPIFEGAQGVLLDEYYGFLPFNTWSKTTPANAREMLKGYKGEVVEVGVLRAYASRHGNGPFVTEDKNILLKEPHNVYNPWQGHFRFGHFDLKAVLYSLLACGRPVDELVLTHNDYFKDKEKVKVCNEYNIDVLDKLPRPGLSEPERERISLSLFTAMPIYENINCSDFRNFLEQHIAPLKLISNGPKHTEKQWV